MMNISSGRFDVYGTLKAKESTFTWADGEHLWGGMRILDRKSSASVLDKCVFEHAEGVTTYSSIDPAKASVIAIRGSSPAITGSTIGKSTALSGICSTGASPTVTNCCVSGFSGGSGAFIEDSSVTVAGNTLTNNDYGISLSNSGASKLALKVFPVFGPPISGLVARHILAQEDFSGAKNRATKLG
jgi:parallel beta-helix repeat protein